MPKYLVAYENTRGYDENFITVTDDVDGFGIGVLACYPVQRMEAETPQLAGYRYARRHGIDSARIVINLASYLEEWWVGAGEAHRIDDRIDPIWEDDDDEAGGEASDE